MKNMVYQNKKINNVIVKMFFFFSLDDQFYSDDNSY